MMRAVLGAIALALALPGAALAQDADLAARIEAARAAEERGAELHLHDRAIALAVAAWERETGTAPFVSPATLSLPVEGSGRIAVSFYGYGDEPQRFATYDVDPAAGTATLRWQYGDGPFPALGAEEARLLAAFATALEADLAQGDDRCPGLRTRTIVLPGRADGTVPIYRLTAPANATSVQLGRSERFDIAADGSLAAHAVLVAACETIAWDAADDELAMRAYYAAHDGPQPHEIHAFAGHFLPFALGVVTGGWVWPVLGGSIAEPVEADPEMIAAP